MLSYKACRCVAWLCVSLLVATPVMGAEQSLPDIGSFSSLSRNDERLIGQNWLYQSRNRLSTISGVPQLEEYIDQLVHEVGAYSGISHPSFTTIVVRDQQINAFAVPGEVLGIYLGLLVAVKSEDELASVIAHELGHISQRHYAELVSHQDVTSTLTLGAMLTGIGLLLAGLPTYGIASIAGSVALNSEKTLQSIRLNESEADNIAFDIMHRSGRDSMAIVTMFERLYQQAGDGQVPLIFRTHPLTITRISQARLRVQSLPSNGYQNESTRSQDNVDFFIAHVIARILLTTDQNLMIRVLEKEAELVEKEDQRVGIEYGLASLYNTIGQPDIAFALLENAREKYPLNISIQSLLAEIEAAQGQYHKAEKGLKHALRISPRNYTLSATLSTIYFDQGKYTESATLLESMIIDYPDNPWLWSQLEEIYGKLKQFDKVHYARGEQYFLRGRYGIAKVQLGYALNKTSDDLFQFHVTQRLSEIEEYEKSLQSLL